MAVVENQRVSQPVGPQVVGLLMAQGFVQLFIKGKGGVKVVTDLLPFLLGSTCVQDDGTGMLQIHGDLLLSRKKAVYNQ